MPRELFLSPVTRPSPRRSPWTITGSFLAHTLALGTLLVVPLLSSADLPSTLSGIPGFVVVAPPPKMPEPPPARSAQQAASPVNRDAAPTQAPDTLKPELPPASASGTGGAPALGVPVGSAAIGVPGGQAIPMSPPPAPPRVVRVGGDIRPPNRIAYVPPVYPSVAQAARVEGAVVLEAVIDETGVVRDVKVIQSIPLLDRAAAEAVSRWRYTPTRLNGIPVSVIMRVTVTFTLR